jgi:hypothetical protein
MPAHCWLHALAGALLWSSLAVVQAATDPYLELLDEEATKVERRSTDTGTDADSAARVDDPRPGPSRERFEALLEQQHVGTYSFYRKLPERSREEVFLDYSSGASMDALREKIVDRYLHP